MNRCLLVLSEAVLYIIRDDCVHYNSCTEIVCYISLYAVRKVNTTLARGLFVCHVALKRWIPGSLCWPLTRQMGMNKKMQEMPEIILSRNKLRRCDQPHVSYNETICVTVTAFLLYSIDTQTTILANLEEVIDQTLQFVIQFMGKLTSICHGHVLHAQ
jgi:hypothetical protein